MKVRTIIILGKKIVADTLNQSVDIDDEYVHIRGQMFSLKNSSKYWVSTDDLDIIMLDEEENSDITVPKVKPPIGYKRTLFIADKTVMDEKSLSIEIIEQYKYYCYVDGVVYKLLEFTELDGLILVYMTSNYSETHAISPSTNAKVILPTKL